MSIKAYAYVRFSSDAQSDGDSIERQLASAETYAAAHGLELDTSYRDEGVSGFKGSNRKEGALGRFLRKVITGEVAADSYLIIEDFDRLSREPVTTALATFTALINAGIVIVTTMDDAVYSRTTIDKEWSKLIVGLARMAAAHVESEKKSERALRNWKVRRESGVTVDALTKPAWLDVVDGEFKVNDDKARVLNRIFSEVASGVGVDRVARRLNEDGEEAWGVAYKATGSRAGKTRLWHGSYIQVILNGRAVIGEHQHHQYAPNSRRREPVGDPIPGYFPAAISLDLYHRAKAAFKSRNVGGGRKEASLVNLFGDAIQCAHCGSRMRWCGHHNRQRDGGNFAYYRCSSAVQRSGCDHDPKHRVVYLENAVLDLVLEIRLEGLADDAEAKAVLAEARHQLQAAKDRADKAGRLVFDMDTGERLSRKDAFIPVNVIFRGGENLEHKAALAEAERRRGLVSRLVEIVRADADLMEVLVTVRNLGLNDWLVFSGAVYQSVWNDVTGRAPGYGVKDFDVGYFDDDVSWDAEDAVIKLVAEAFEEPLRSRVEVRNQQRVAEWFEAKFGEPYPPIEDTAEALTRFVAPAFAVGVKLEDDDQITVVAPFGLDDVFNLTIRPNRLRPLAKDWDRVTARALERWPELTIVAPE